MIAIKIAAQLGIAWLCVYGISTLAARLVVVTRYPNVAFATFFVGGLALMVLSIGASVFVWTYGGAR